MKNNYRVLGLIILIFSLLYPNISFSQYADAGVSNRWGLGFNFGGTWQTSDAERNRAGFAGGLTLGRHYLQNTNSPFYLGLRFRYLAGNTYGQDYKRSYGLKNNVALNGTTDSTLNYDSIPGYYFHNYKSTLGEMGLELQLGFNGLRKKTGILLYLFGGAGFSASKVMINAKDQFGNMYDYSGIDTSSAANAQAGLTSLMDFTYETSAEGHAGANYKYYFMVTGGVGLGKMLGKHMSIGLEYKATLPFSGDLIDGKQWSNTNALLTKTNYYHYFGGYMKFYLGGKTHTRDTVKNDHNQYTTTGLPPQVIITSPGNNFTTSNNRITVQGTVTNINYQSSIRVKINGLNHTDFLWNSATKAISINAVLVPGANAIEVKATNNWGVDSKTVTIIYQEPINLRPVPIVMITNPAINPYASQSSMMNVNATVLNVDNGSQITVVHNNMTVSNFSYDLNSKVLSYTAMLSIGANTITVTANNGVGVDSKSVTITYQPVSTGAKPIITIFDPVTNPFNYSVSVANVIGQVLNVNSGSDIGVSLNSQNVNFQYNPSNKSLTIQAGLNPGNNSLVIVAQNQFGTDTKALTLVYVELPKPQKPEVIFTSPNTDPFTSVMASMNVTADVHHVVAKQNIQVTLNGNAVNFNYNPTTDKLSLIASLIQGANVVAITATNNAGMDAKSTTILYQPVNTTPKPIVTITTPATNPHNTNAGTQQVQATILNINTSQDISVTVNGAPFTMFSYNMVTKVLTMNAVLMQGSNNVTIKATNSAGFDSKTATINYSIVQLPKPVVTINFPQQNPYTTTQNSTAINATVLNVNAVSEITVLMNGSPFTNFSYSMSTKVLTMNAILIPGANNITITASNAGGSDSKTQIINLQSTPVPSQVPVVTITSPQPSPHTTAVTPGSVTATVLNVANSNQISVTVNGAPFTTFIYSTLTKQLGMSPNLILGNNSVTITATNSAGTDSKTVVINYQLPSPAPVVTITSPTTNPYTSRDCILAVTASIQNITSQNNISVTMNGSPFTGFSFNASNGILTINTTQALNNSYTFVITATNNNGTDSKSVTINCPSTVPTPGGAPVVTIISPNQPVVTHNGNNCNINIVAKITGITSQNQISITLNGSPFTNYTWNANSQHVNINMQNVSTQVNVFVISATNSFGSDSKTVTFNCNPAPPPPPPPAQAPVVTIISPNQSVVTHNGNNCNINIVAKITNITAQNQISITLNGSSFTNYTWNANSQHVNINMQNVSTPVNVFVISATNTSGSDSKTVTFNCNPAPPPPPPPAQAPVVTIISPNQSVVTHNGNNCNINIVAKITNITAQNQISITLNGSPFTNYTWNANSQHVNINMQNVSTPVNVFVIAATNTAGSDSKTVTFNCNPAPPPPPPPAPAPIVTIISPNQSTVTNNGNNCNINIVAKITGITAQNQISITMNGSPFTNYTWNANSQHVNINMQHSQNTTNMFVIAAANSSGSDSKTVTFICNAPAQLNKPVITMIDPASDPYAAPSENITITAKIEGITATSDITIKVNNLPNGNFSWNATTKVMTLNATLNAGANTVKITATNGQGPSNKIITINVGSDNKSGNGPGKNEPPPAPKPTPAPKKPEPKKGDGL